MLGNDLKIQSKQVNRQIFAEIHCSVDINRHGLFALQVSWDR